MHSCFVLQGISFSLNHSFMFCFFSGLDHTVTHRGGAATPQVESLMQILGFMVCGLISMMAHTLLTVILTTLSTHLRYFIIISHNLLTKKIEI